MNVALAASSRLIRRVSRSAGKSAVLHARALIECHDDGHALPGDPDHAADRLGPRQRHGQGTERQAAEHAGKKRSSNRPERRR